MVRNTPARGNALTRKVRVITKMQIVVTVLNTEIKTHTNRRTVRVSVGDMMSATGRMEITARAIMVITILIMEAMATADTAVANILSRSAGPGLPGRL